MNFKIFLQRPLAHYGAKTCLSLLIALKMIVLPAVAQARSEANSIVHLPIVANNTRTCYTNVANTPFGFQMYGSTSASDKYYKDLIASSASWVRVPIHWSSIEPSNTTPSNYRWSSADGALGAARDGCLNIVATILSPPSFAWPDPSIYSDMISPSKLSDFAQFVQALVERYDGDGKADAPGSPVVNDWEFFNEPDGLSAPNVDGWGDHGAEYAAMLKAAYPAVKAANPNAKVVFGGLAYDWWKETQGGPFSRAFLDDVLTAGAGGFFDVMNYHFYPIFASNWTTEATKNHTSFMEKAAAIRTKLQSYGITKPMVVTEMGWHNNPNQQPASSDETQVRYVTILFAQSIAANINYSIWWTLADVGEPALDTGLVTDTTPPQRKLAFKAFYYLSQEMRTAAFDRALTQSETGQADMEAYKFVDAQNQRSIIIAWLNPITTSATASLRLSATTVTVRDAFNVTTTVTDSADGLTDGKVTVVVSGRPVYIEVPQ